MLTSADYENVTRAANQRIESLLFEWFPQGVIEGNEFCIGSRYGDAGQSLRVRCKGAEGGKLGFWAEFSADGEAGGDLISLYAYIHGLSNGKACAELAKALGVTISAAGKAAPQPIPARPAPAEKKPQESAPAQAGQGVGKPAESKSRSPWKPLLPIPEDAPPPPLAHYLRGRPDATWTYRDQLGRLLGYIWRCKNSKGGKEILPLMFAENAEESKREWRWMQFPEPRPLYLPAPLRDGIPVLVVEGEKCADAGFALLSDAWDVVSWPGGGKVPDKADWSLLAGRRVTLWADADAKRYKKGHALEGQLMPHHAQPGFVTMQQVDKILSALGCAVRHVDIPDPDASRPGIELFADGHDGWDIADLIAGGASRADIDAWLDHLVPVVQSAPEAEPAVGEGDIPSWVTGPAGEGGAPPPGPPPDASGAQGDLPHDPAGAKPMSRRALRDSMIPTSNGGVKSCRENVYTALMHDPCLKGLVALDKFSLLQVKRATPPWPSEPGEWTEGDDFHLGAYLAKHYGLIVGAIGEIERAVAQAARENAFNPVIDLFNRCADEWDGTARVEGAFSAYWGAPASDYMCLISRMFFVGLAKRVYEPGVKHDDAPVFEGKQGEGKSTLLSILGGEWFADTPFRMGDKDGYLSIQGILIYEIAELEQFNRSEVTAVKAFMSSQKDRYREPYGRRMKNQPRRTVFAATTNEGQYFKDPTGNRRFWPVETGELDVDGFRRDRDQLIGEAVHMMRKGVLWYPTKQQQRELISPVQADREIWDEWTGRVWEYLEGKSDDGQENLAMGRKKRVTGREILTKALGIEIGKISQAKTETMRISNIMRKLGWSKDRETSGAREWFYVRPEPEKSAPAAPAHGDHDDSIPF